MKTFALQIALMIGFVSITGVSSYLLDMDYERTAIHMIAAYLIIRHTEHRGDNE